MNFLNPALWPGLLFASLPILIHLLGKRRLKRQPFPSLEFLKRLQVKRMRKLRVRQWIILLLRTLAILFLAFALLRPTLIGDRTGRKSVRDSVLLLDLSASMFARRPDGMPIQKVREYLRDYFEMGNSEGKIAVVFMDAAGEDDIPWQDRPQSTPAWVQQLKTDGRSEACAKSWFRVSQLLNSSDAPNKEVFWFSDFTSSPDDSILAIPDSVKIWRIPTTGSSSAMNAEIVDLKFGSLLFQPGSPANISVDAALHDGNNETSAILSILMNGQRVAESEIQLKPGEETTHLFAVPIRDTGRIEGEAQIEIDDAFSLDNRYPFVLHVPDQLHILLTGDDPSGITFVSAALRSQNVDQLKLSMETRQGSLEGIDLDSYSSIVIVGKSRFNRTEIRKLKEFIGKGGGLWVILGSRMDAQSFSRDFLPVLKIGELLDEIALPVYTSRWDDFNTHHPALVSLLTKGGKVESPMFKRYFRFQPARQSRVLISLTDGSPFLIESNMGNGRIWLTSSAADTAWNDWPLQGIFAPMILSGVHYLSTGNTGITQPIECGDPVRWTRTEDDQATIREALDPMGNRIPVSPAFSGVEKIWQVEVAKWPGQYELLDGAEVIDVIPVRTRHEESDLHVVEEYSWPGELLNVNRENTLSSLLSEMEYGHEISWLFYFLALIALLTELFLARASKPGDTSEKIAGRNM